MDLNKLNTLIEKVRNINSQEPSPKRQEELFKYLKEIKLQYGSFLLEKLFDIYDVHFANLSIKSLEDYISTEGVEVESEKLDKSKIKLSIKSYPLRFELEGINQKYKSILWAAA
jgi:hypothetical protein